MHVTKVRQRVDGRTLKRRGSLDLGNLQEKDLPAALYNLNNKLNVNLMAFDSATVGSPTIANGALPLNLLVWLPGAIKQLTQVRKIDELLGITSAGDWLDEIIVQRAITFSGNSEAYGDTTNIPLASYSPEYITRNVVTRELGTSIGKRQAGRAAKNGDNPEEYSRDAVFETLEVVRNLIGFFGIAGGEHGTYGYFNDPNLPASTSLPANSAGNVSWALKNFEEITQDIALMVSTIVLSSGGHIDDDSAMTMSLPLSCNQYLSKMNQLGSKSVKEWVKETYPNLRIVLVPEADKVNGGLNEVGLFADNIADSGTDNGSVFDQIVIAKLMALNVDIQAKQTIEDYVMSTAGVMLKRPYAFASFTGL